MRIKVRIIFFSLLFCLSALAEEDQFEIRMYINGISQTGNVLIKDGDLCEMLLYDKYNNKEIKNVCSWKMTFKDTNTGNELVKNCDDYVENNILKFKMQPSFTGRIFCNSKLSKYNKIIYDSWSVGYSQLALAKCEFLYDGKVHDVVKEISFDVLPTLPKIKVCDVVYIGDYKDEKNYDVSVELSDGKVDMAGFVLIDEEYKDADIPPYYYYFIDEGTTLPCIEELSDICEHIKWFFFNENDYGVSTSDWMGLDVSGISPDKSPKCTISLNGNVLKISSLNLLKEIEVYSLSGTLLYSSKNTYCYECILPCGLYILRIVDNKGRITKNIKI